MIHDPLDQTANLSENMYKDNNGEYGGLVKVKLAASGATFEGWILHEQPRGAGEYWVFMAKGSSRLTIKVSGHLPLDVNFRDYEDCIIRSQHTYVLTINVPQLMQAGPVDDGMRYLPMKVEPKNSMVFVDDKPLTLDANGEVTVYLPMGKHSYKVMANGYAEKEGTVNVTDNTPLLEVKLKSTQGILRVECETQGAIVYVNGQQRGNAPWSGQLPEGSYKVEARLDGYRTGQKTVELAKGDSRTVSIPALQMIAGRLNVDYRPIGSEVYVDGKKVGTSPNIFRNIAVGSRTVEIRKDDYEPLKKTVEVKENEQASLTGSLTAVASSTSQSSSASNGASSFASGKEVFTANGVSFTMIRVDGGTFTMGATEEQGSDADDDEKPAHEVTLSTYMIGETEVTQALWQAVMGSNPSRFTDNSQNPVERVSWDDCKEFIKKLNSLTGKSFRLPTEAEWEFAARGGNKSKHYKYSGSNTLEDVAWYGGNSGSKTYPVKMKSANELGLYDMSGNVWEWCEDWYGKDYYKFSPKSNPKGPSSGSNCVRRGGSWNNGARDCRVSIRIIVSPGSRYFHLGLRLAL